MDNAAALPKRFTFHTPQMTARVLSLLSFLVYVCMKRSLWYKDLRLGLCQSICENKTKKPKSLNICNVAIEHSSDLGKDKHLSWPLVEKKKCLYHTSLFVQTSSESHTQKKKIHLCKNSKPIKVQVHFQFDSLVLQPLQSFSVAGLWSSCFDLQLGTTPLGWWRDS